MEKLVVLVLLAVLAPRAATAACTDAAAAAAFRADVASQCDCATAARHKAYVRCVARAAGAAVKAGTLPASCKGAVTRCAAKSTCGKPGAVTCCVQKKSGAHACSVAKDAASCARKKGTAGGCTSCCDACGDAGCPAVATSTSTTTGQLPTTTIGAATVHTVDVGPDGQLVFQPKNLTIDAGDTVHWVWRSSLHNVVSGPPGNADGRFCSPTDSGCASAPTSNAGATYDHRFTTPGTFPYFCAPHASLGMTGTITVR